MARRPTRQQIAQTVTIPAPVGGINARDSIAAMPPTDAVSMVNWFPSTTSLNLRGGSTTWVSGLPGWVDTLMVYNSPTGARQMFGVSSGKIYNCTGSGTAGAALVTGLTSNRLQSALYGTGGGVEYLVAGSGNGVDYMQIYNGSTWQEVTGSSTPIAITGVDTRLLTNPLAFKGRLYFVVANSMTMAYLPVNQVGGAASIFDFSPLFKLGGYLMTICAWNIQNVAGPQDYFAAISSEGEVIVYQGYDPTQAGTWGEVGNFRIGRPIGRRCVTKVGADNYVISADGLFPLSQAMQTDRSNDSQSVTYKIVNLINNDVQSYGANFGWTTILHPIGNKLLVNVPQLEDSTQYQYVMNTITGAWTTFTGWNAACWALMGDQLFFGTNGKVVQADIGTNDDGAAITTDLIPAYSAFGAPGVEKYWTMARPTFQYSAGFSATGAMCTDFQTIAPSNSLQLPPIQVSATWNVSPWNTTYWQSGTVTKFDWQGAGGIGFYGSYRIQTLSTQSTISLLSIDLAFIKGGAL